MDDKEYYEEWEDITDSELSEDDSVREYYFANTDPYLKFQPVSEERRNHNHWIDGDGNIRVKNISAYWIPDAKFEMEIGGTIYTVTGSYEGSETMDKKWQRILAKWAGDIHDK